MKFDIGFREYDLGEGVTCELKPLSVTEFQQVLRVMGGAIPKDGEEITLTGLSDVDLLTISGELFSVHVREIKGIQMQDGEKLWPATVEDIISQGAFIGTIVQILVGLITVSTVSETDQGN